MHKNSISKLQRSVLDDSDRVSESFGFSSVLDESDRVSAVPLTLICSFLLLLGILATLSTAVQIQKLHQINMRKLPVSTIRARANKLAYVCCCQRQLQATNPGASLELVVFSHLELRGLKTSAAAAAASEVACCSMCPPPPAAMLVDMFSSAMVSRVLLALVEYRLSTVMSSGGAVSNHSAMADMFSRIVSSDLCFGDVLSTVII
jgi:hypothetical protein